MTLIVISARAQDQPKPDDYKIYLNKLEDAAKKGDPKSQVCLGATYASGIDTGKDFNKALEWYKAAADQGDAEGKRHIAQLYNYGLGVEQDVKKANFMFQSLVDQNYAPAYVDVAFLYLDGRGVPKSDAVATKWMEKGADAGDYEAQTRLAIFYHLGSAGLKKDPALSKKWLDEAANHKIDCAVDYIFLIPFLAEAVLVQPDPKLTMGAGRVGIRFIYDNQKPTHIEFMQHSGSNALDEAWFNAISATTLPRWPESYIVNNKMMGFWVGDDTARIQSDLAPGIKDAIAKAKFVPKKILLFGTKGDGKPEVSFDYLDAKVSNVIITRSSNDDEVDAAAIRAVEGAHYPATPAQYATMKLHFKLVVSFENYVQTPVETTKTAPTATTLSHGL